MLLAKQVLFSGICLCVCLSVQKLKIEIEVTWYSMYDGELWKWHFTLTFDLGSFFSSEVNFICHVTFITFRVYHQAYTCQVTSIADK